MSKTFDVVALQREAAELRDAWKMSLWQHYKGGVYTVLDVVVDEASGDLLVVYKSEERGYRWSRPLRVWHERVNPTRENLDGVPRFQSL